MLWDVVFILPRPFYFTQEADNPAFYVISLVGFAVHANPLTILNASPLVMLFNIA